MFYAQLKEEGKNFALARMRLGRVLKREVSFAIFPLAFVAVVWWMPECWIFLPSCLHDALLAVGCR